MLVRQTVLTDPEKVFVIVHRVVSERTPCGVRTDTVRRPNVRHAVYDGKTAERSVERVGENDEAFEENREWEWKESDTCF